jgi:uncharacterized Fe-S cluster-containing radical SAM superfamily protein
LPVYREVPRRAPFPSQPAETPRVAFRDPTSLGGRARALKLEIVRELVGADTLPIRLPAFGLTLIDVRADRAGIELLVGPNHPMARLRVSWEPRKGMATIEVVPTSSGATRWARALETLRRRLSIAVTEARYQHAAEPARRLSSLPLGIPLGFFRQLVAGHSPPQGLVRTGFRCNQDCGMCWQDRDWGTFDPEQILRWIEDLHAAGATGLTISGGEPTLDSELGAYVRHARAIGFSSVILETNAIQAGKRDLASRLQADGVTGAFVSLHSADGAVSDAITRAPGTHERTVRGITALLSAGIEVTLNAVMTAEGLDRLPELPNFVHRHFGAHPKLRGLMLSYPTEPFDSTLSAGILPPPERLRDVLGRTIARALALDIEITGLDGPCGPALCAFGADPRLMRSTVRQPVDFRLRLPECDGCAVADLCLGVRHADVEHFGGRCVAPIARRPDGLAPAGADVRTPVE